MRRVKGVRLLGVRVGNWLTAEEGLLPARPGTVGLIIRFLFIGPRVCLWGCCLRLFCLAKTLRVRRINDLEAHLPRRAFRMIP